MCLRAVVLVSVILAACGGRTPPPPHLQPAPPPAPPPVVAPAPPPKPTPEQDFLRATIPNAPPEHQELARRCDDGDLVACGVLADTVAFDSRAAAHAFQLLTRLCDANDYHACMLLARFYSSGNESIGLSRDKDKSSSLNRKACDGNDAWACRILAERARDAGTPDDWANARVLYTKGCNLDQVDSPTICAVYGQALDEAQIGPRDAPAAYQAYRRACTTGARGSCVRANVMLAKGDGVAKDEATARAALAETCKDDAGIDLYPVDCRAFAALLRTGLAGKKDEPEAMRIDGVLCPPPALKTRGYVNAEACLALGNAIAAKRGGAKEAAEYFTEACKRGNKPACKLAPRTQKKP